MNSAWWQAEIERIDRRLDEIRVLLTDVRLATHAQNELLRSHTDRIRDLEREGFRRVPRPVPLPPSQDMGDGWRGWDRAPEPKEAPR